MKFMATTLIRNAYTQYDTSEITRVITVARTQQKAI